MTVLERPRISPPGAVTRDPVRRGLFGLTGLTLLYLVAVPLFFLLYGSLFTGRPGQAGTFSLDTYRAIFSSARSYRLLGMSFLYGLLSTIVSLAIGVTIAWLVKRTDLPGRRVLTFFALLPLFMPTVLTTLSWVLLLDRNVGLINNLLRGLLPLETGPFNIYTFLGMVWVRGIMDVPLIVLWMWPALSSMDPGLEEAGATSGSSPAKVIRTISLPLLRPALLAAFLISFVTSLEDVTVPVFIGMRAGVDVFASELYIASTRVPRDLHGASGYAVILLAITLSLTLVYRRLTFHSERYVTIRGRGYRPTLLPLGRARWPVAIGVTGFLTLSVGLPLFILAWTSFMPFVQVPSLAGVGRMTLSPYRTLLADPLAVRGLWNSLRYGLLTAVLVMTLSLAIGWLVIRSRSRSSFVLDFLAFTPIGIPGLVVGIALMWLYLTVPLPVYGTATILVVAYVTRLIPYGVRLSYSGFTQLHPELEEAASTSGAGWFKSMRTVSAPILLPTLLAGAIYIFLRAYRELPASLLLTSFGNEPYSVVAFHMWSSGNTTKVAAYGVIVIAVTIVVVTLLQRFRGSIVD